MRLPAEDEVAEADHSSILADVLRELGVQFVSHRRRSLILRVREQPS